MEQECVEVATEEDIQTAKQAQQQDCQQNHSDHKQGHTMQLSIPYLASSAHLRLHPFISCFLYPSCMYVTVFIC